MRCTPATRQSNRNILSEIAHLAKSLYSRLVQNENTFYFGGTEDPIPVAVWGTGNMGRAAIRAVDAHPGLRLRRGADQQPRKAGRDAGELAGLDRELGVALTTDVDAALARSDGGGAVAYMASGDVRPDDAVADIRRALAAGASWSPRPSTPSTTRATRPAELRDPLLEAARAGGAALFVCGHRPRLGQRRAAGAGERAGRRGRPGAVPGDLRLLDLRRPRRGALPGRHGPADGLRAADGRRRRADDGLGRAGADDRPGARASSSTRSARPSSAGRWRQDVTTALGLFEAGTQGALRFEVQGIVGGEPRIVVEHVTRIAPDCAPDWPVPADGGDGAHRVVIEGRPRIEVSLEATDEGGNRAAGGNATAANRLVNAIPWLRAAEPGLYDGLDVPLSPATGRLTRATTRKAPA